MVMSSKGMNKLVEECGELICECGKKLAYFDTDEHPDGKGSMQSRIEDEMGDVLAAINFVIGKFNLDQDRIRLRLIKKYQQFQEWDQDPTC